MNRFTLPFLLALALPALAQNQNNKPPVANQVANYSQYLGATRSIDLLSAFTDPDATNAVRLTFSNFGNIDMMLYGTQTPITVANFLRYVREGRYFFLDAKSNYLAHPMIHRSVYDSFAKKPFIIQGGGYFGDVSPLDKKGWQAIGLDDIGQTLPAIKNEPGISNTLGTIAMAKISGQPNSATSQWFINLSDNGGDPSYLDTTNGGFTVFGRVTAPSMSVAYAINSLSRVTVTRGDGVEFDDVPMRNYTQTDYNNGKEISVPDNLVTMDSIAEIPAMTFTASSDNTAVADVSLAGTFLHVLAKQNGTANINVTATDLDGAMASQTFQVKVVAPATGHLANISTRLPVGTGDNVLIGGFIVKGTAPKHLLVRGIGPSLSSAGVASPLADPVIELHDSTGAVVASNDNWQTNTNAAAITDTGVPPTSPNESAILMDVPVASNGTAYTAILRGGNNGTGVGLVEIYDLDSGPGSIVLNISTRGQVQTGDNVMIGGFILGGSDSKNVLVRGIGPSLAKSGVTGALADPQLELHNAQGAIVDQNDDWQSSAQKSQIQASGVAPSDPKEAATYDTLPPGAYTAVLRGGGSQPTGVALVEVYQLP